MCQYIAEYRVEKKLGFGAFGEIFLVSKVMDRGQQYVIKKIPNDKMKMAEVEAGEMLEHENIVKFYEHFQDQHAHYLVFEYVPGVDLFSWMEMRSFGQLQEKLARKIFQDISSAIQYCHQKGIAHRDLKLENILIDPTTYRVKLIDFGLCSFEQEDSAGCVDVCGSLDYIAPEVLTEQPYSAKRSDMWSLGVILYSLLFATFPFSTEERMDALLPPEGQDKRPHPEAEFPTGGTVSRDAQDLCSKLLSIEPNFRISIESVVKHPWMTATDKNDAATNNSNKAVRINTNTKRHNKFTRNASDSRVGRSNNSSSAIRINNNYNNTTKNSNSNNNDNNGNYINDLLNQICRDFGNINVRTCPSGCKNGCVRDCGSEVPACLHDCSCREYLPAPV